MAGLTAIEVTYLEKLYTIAATLQKSLEATLLGNQELEEVLDQITESIDLITKRDPENTFIKTHPNISAQEDLGLLLEDLQTFEEQHPELLPPPAADTNISDLPKPYHAACKELIDSQFVPIYNSHTVGGGLYVDPAIERMMSRRINASLNFINEFRKLKLGNNIKFLASEAARLQEACFKQHGHHVSFILATDHFSDEDCAFVNSMYEQLSDIVTQYIVALENWVNAQGRSGFLNTQESTNTQIVAEKRLQEIQKKLSPENRYYCVPGQQATLVDLVFTGINFMLPEKARITQGHTYTFLYFNKTKPEAEKYNPQFEWPFLLSYANIKFGPGALLNAFNDELILEQNRINTKTRSRRVQAIKACILIVVGLTIAAAGVTAAFVSCGALTPVALLAFKIASGIIGGALTLYGGKKLITRSREINKDHYKIRSLASYCQNSDGSELIELTDTLPQLLPKKVMGKR